MSNLFIGKNYALLPQIKVILHVAIAFCVYVHPTAPIFAATTHKELTRFQQITLECTSSLCGEECKQNKKSTTCWETAGAHFEIDPLLLKAIAWKESRGRPHAVGQKLKDGNVALGLMQINTIHLKNLRQFGIDRDKLFDACISQQVGAWVLADCISKFGTTWKAVGCYYTGPGSNNTTAQVAYVNDVRRFYAGYKKQAQQRSIHFNERID